MKKIVSAVLAAAIILALAGCNGDKPSSTDPAVTTAGTSGGAVTQVYEPDVADTTEQALEYLSKVAPLFRKYLEKRRQFPMTIETVVKTSSGEWKSNIYLKDEQNAIASSTDPSGNETRTVYTVDKGFQLDVASKKAYVQALSEDHVKRIVATYVMTMRESEVKSASYATGTGTVEGVEYNCESITVDGSETVYYYSKDTDDLVLIKDGETLTRITRLENVFDRDDLLTIPADFEQLTYEDLVNSEQGVG